MNLEQHQDNHIGLVSCDGCGIQCMSDSFLRNHKKYGNKACRRRNTSRDSSLSTSSTSSNTESFKCSECSFTFNVKQNLTRHQKHNCKGKGNIFYP